MAGSVGKPTLVSAEAINFAQLLFIDFGARRQRCECACKPEGMARPDHRRDPFLALRPIRLLDRIRSEPPPSG